MHHTLKARFARVAMRAARCARREWSDRWTIAKKSFGAAAFLVFLGLDEKATTRSLHVVARGAQT